MQRYILNEQDTTNFAQKIASCLFIEPIQTTLVLTISGILGVGKTTLIRAILRSLGVDASIKSPTYSLVESYNYQDVTLHHFDLYRIQNESELEYMGFRDYFNPYTICLIEWPEMAPTSLNIVDIKIMLNLYEQNHRLLEIDGLTSIGMRIVTCLKALVL